MLTYETAVDGSDVIACHFSPSATPIYQSASSLKSMNLDCVKRIISHLSSMARRASLAVSAKLVSVTLTQLISGKYTPKAKRVKKQDLKSILMLFTFTETLSENLLYI